MVPLPVRRAPASLLAALLTSALAAAFLITLPAAAPAAADDGATADGGALVEPFDTLSTSWHAASGAWRAEGGAAVAGPRGGDRGQSLALVGFRLGPAGGSVSSTFSLSGTAADSSWGGVQVHRDAVGDDFTTSGYTALLRRSGELALVRAAGDGAVTYLARAATPARPATGPVTVTVEVGPGTVSATAGGVRISAADTTFTGGGISLVAHRDSAIAVDEMRADGLVAVEEAAPLPAGCVARPDVTVGTDRGPGLLPDERVDLVRDRVRLGLEPQASAFALLQTELAADLARQPAAPDVFFVPFFYNDPTAHRAARDGLQNDADAAYRLALAYRVTGDEAYGRHAAALLDAWSQVRCFRTGEDSALAFSYHVPALVSAGELLRGRPVWSADAEARFATFLATDARRLSGSIAHRTNNWGSWGVATSALVEAYLADEAALTAVVDRARELLDGQLAPDGHLPEEVGRNDGVGDYGIWYSHFSLMPNLLTAEVAATRGTDLFTYRTAGGATLEDAVELVAGWVDDPETFPFFTGDDLEDLANVRTIDYLRDAGVLAHSMSYFEIAASRYDAPVVERLVAEEGPMTTIHAAPHLTLTHGDITAEDLVRPDLAAHLADPPGDLVAGRTVPLALHLTDETGAGPAPAVSDVVDVLVVRPDGTRTWVEARRQGADHRVLLRTEAGQQGTWTVLVTTPAGWVVGEAAVVLR